MTQLDLAIRGGTIVTASDEFRADIGIRDGRIVSIADSIEGARARSTRPGCWRCRAASTAMSTSRSLRPRRGDGRRLRLGDAFGGRRRQHHGLPFALQREATSLRACVENYRKLAEGECYIDTAFHLIVSDPTAAVLGQELPALVKDGYTSFKVFMTYDDLVLSDQQLLEVFEVARREEALVMVHCEGYDAIRFLTERLEREGNIAPYYHAVSRPQAVEREATHRAISHAE